MKEIIATGRNVDEATENGLKELGVTRDEVSIEIVEMPTRKFFKMLPAKVKLVLKETAPEAVPQPVEKAPAPPVKAKLAPVKEEKQEVKKPAQQAAVLPEEPEEPIDISSNEAVKRAVDYLTEVFNAIGITGFDITAIKQGEATLLCVEGDNFSEYLDVRGDTIQALSHLTDRAVNKGVDKRDADYLHIRLDIAGYRDRRKNELVALAQRTGKEVVSTKRSRTLAPMNSYERLIIHNTINTIEGLTSESIGTDTERRVVIKSTAPDATEGEDWRPVKSRSGNNRGRGGSRSGGNNRGGRGGRNNSSQRGGRGGSQRGSSSTPGREYAGRQRENTAPIVPERREAIKDGEDLPLYGKIEL